MLAMDIGLSDVLVYIVVGLVVGALARLIIPGRQPMGILATIVIGIVAAVIGGLLWNAIFPSNSGIAWIASIALAVLFVWIYAGATRSSSRV